MIASILDKALSLGASLAGIAELDEALRARVELPGGVDPSRRFTSVFVLALAHGEDEPELDWWGGPGGTEGNRRLQVLAEDLQRCLARELGIRSRILPYHPWKGGVLLKNAAALAGLGVIGVNNLLVTPQFGPRVRLRAMLLDARPPIDPEHPEPVEGYSSLTGFVPCEGCARPCWRACPQGAFASGAYDRARCEVQMQHDEASAGSARGYGAAGVGIAYVPYCRACELACPVGK